MLRRTERRGYTILELMVVLAILVILGGMVIPTMAGYRGNSHQRAAADGIRARVADARAKAMKTGNWYRLALNQDKTRIRLAPDGPDFASLAADPMPSIDSAVSEDRFEEGVTAEPVFDSDDQVTTDSAGWITIATVGPDGTCKEDGARIIVRERDFRPIEIRIRGVTGTARFIRPQQGGQP